MATGTIRNGHFSATSLLFCEMYSSNSRFRCLNKKPASTFSSKSFEDKSVSAAMFLTFAVPSKALISAAAVMGAGKAEFLLLGNSSIAYPLD